MAEDTTVGWVPLAQGLIGRLTAIGYQPRKDQTLGNGDEVATKP